MDVTGFQNLLIQMALSNSSAPSRAVLYAMLAFSQQHFDGHQGRAIQFKISAIQALATSARETTLDTRELAQHVAAGMLLCSLEIVNYNHPSHRVLQFLSEVFMVTSQALEESDAAHNVVHNINALEGSASTAREIFGRYGSASTEVTANATNMLKLYELAAAIYLSRVSEYVSGRVRDVQSLLDDAFELLRCIRTCELQFPLLILGCESKTDEQRAMMLELVQRTEQKSYYRSLDCLRRSLRALWVQEDLATEGDCADASKSWAWIALAPRRSILRTLIAKSPEMHADTAFGNESPMMIISATAFSLHVLLVLLGNMSHQVLAKTKKFVTPDKYTWVYDYIPAKPTQPTVLLLHGFPASRRDWFRQIDDLSSAGYGVIAPDLLGYGDSDKPTDTNKYKLKTLSRDIDAIIGHEGLDTVVGVGHDWGVNVLSAAAVWYPERFEKLAFLDVGYSPPGFFDVDAINANGLANWGYTPFGYWYFFNSYDAANLMRDNIESAWHLIFPVRSSLWRNNLAGIAGARAWLSNGTTTALPAYRNETDKADWIKHYSVPGNLEASLNTYRSLMRGTQASDIETVTEADKVLKVPVLGVAATQDVIARPEFLRASNKAYARNGHTEKSLDCGHWIMLEKGKDLSDILIEFAARAK
ncbi:hypothetical protein QQS21_011140 [Conoideocrella luteorostrata]|uniref:AB hydrolase-1 domain-containing protein n=1 Tax=Conoideocrella luteorostrata TaxID=1105319 RepID=A0AAJ0FTK6_9HYPO|nr:hypothetical protein QQS21_011140 [Conoideocrella luteorostrata]